MAEINRMAFSGHLNELRRRLLIIVLAILAGFLASFNFSEEIFVILKLPMNSKVSFSMIFPFINLIPTGNKIIDLIFLAPAEAFWVHMKISLIAGIVGMSPVIFTQLWLFITPGLQKNEKRFAIPFVFVTSGLFIFGTLFCFIIVLPFAMNFLLNFKTGSLIPMISVEKYIDFCLKFILAFGIVFELPVVLVFLTRSGLVSVETLSKNRKYAVLMAFVAAALLTPTPDAFNQTLMAVPIIILFEGGLIASRIFAARRKKAMQEDDDDDDETSITESNK
jgi:sec-independent protein translocase protein TatC